MKVPKSIRDVPRPPGTVVYAFGDPPRYNVKERTYGTRPDGTRFQKDGATVGSIEDGRFVPARPRMSFSESDILSWGPSKLVTLLTGDVLEDLAAVYNREEARQIYVLAVLRAVDGGLKDYEVAEAYADDQLCQSMKGVPLSKDTVGTLLYNLGRTCSRITEFMRLRTARVPAGHILAVDGTLKSYESRDNPLSDFSRKARTKGSRDVSVMYAYDTVAMEPVCSQVNPGNTVDVAAFRSFMEVNRVVAGVVVTDKGFTLGAAEQWFEDNPGLHFVIPLRRDAEVVARYGVLDSDGSLENRSGISCRKVDIGGGRFLYGFRDADRAGAEERTWLDQRKEFAPEELAGFRRNAGTIVFLSDVNTEPEIIYAAYEERWEIEVLFRFYKRILELDETRVESVQSVIGTEFVNFLSVVMTCRLRKAFLYVPEFRRRSFRACMKYLRKGMLVRTEADGEWKLKRLTVTETGVFTRLGLLCNGEAPAKKRGRPKGSKNRKSKVQ